MQVGRVNQKAAAAFYCKDSYLVLHLNEEIYYCFLAEQGRPSSNESTNLHLKRFFQNLRDIQI